MKITATAINILKLIIILIYSAQSIAFCQKYFFKKYTDADGLVQGTVREIYQDSKGRMWFGTVDGLSIYDGTQFYNYNEEEGLKVPIISSFFEISEGVMLVGTLGNGIEVFIKHPYKKDSITYTIKDKKFLIDPRVNQIKRDKVGNIWICTDAGISKWIYKDNSFKDVIHENSFNGLGELIVYSVVFGKDDKIYFTTNKGLLRYHNNKYELIFKESDKSYEPIIYAYADNQNTLWFSSLKQLYQLKDGNVNAFKMYKKGESYAVNSIIENNSGELIIGGLGKLIIVSKEGIKTIDQSNGFMEKAVLSLFYDNEDNLWIGSLEGLSKLSKSNFRFVQSNNTELNFPQIIKTDNKLYLGNADGIYIINNFKLEKPTGYIKNFSKRILDYLVDKDEEWIATDDGVIHHKNGITKYYRESEGLPHNFVYRISRDLSGVVWVLTQGGLAYIKNERIYNFNNKLEKKWIFSDPKIKNMLSATSIRQAVVDSQNTKWITTWREGLIRIRNDSVYCFTERDGLSDLRVRSLFLDNKNNLWIGTRFSGVFKYDGKHFYNYSTKDGLNSNWVFSITEDQFGNCWFCTSKGINKFDGSKWVSFGATDGIFGGEILNNFLYKNIIWFNSWDQVFCYIPDSLNYQQVKPKIYFSQISLLENKLPIENNFNLGKNFSLNDLLKDHISFPPVKIDYGNNTIILDFAGTSYRGENQVRYNYMLEGFDKNWIDNTKRNFVTYTHLPPGDYKFVVYAVNREGAKSELPATFSFTVLSPFWQKWWFISSAVLFFILIVSLINYIIYKYKIWQALKIEKLRSKISSDLHDEIGTSLSSIAIFAELIKREKKSTDNRFSDKLERIENTSRELVDKMSDIVWMVNPGNDKFEDALLKLKDYALTILGSKGIDVEYNVDEVDKDFVLPMEVRRNLLLIYKELVTNAAKYSKASRVLIELRLEDNHHNKIILKVKDDGIGFDYNKIKNGNGVKNIIRRAEELGGKCNLISKPGNGTKAIIEIPII